MCVCVHLVAQSYWNLWDLMDFRSPSLRPWNYVNNNTGVGSHFLLQGIFQIQGSNSNLLQFLHWPVDSLPLSDQGNPISSVQSLRCVQIFVTSWTEASLSITNSWSLLKLISIELVMPSNHLILCCPPYPPTFNLSQHQGLFKWVSSLHQVTKVLEFMLQHQSFQWTLRTDL